MSISLVRFGDFKLFNLIDLVLSMQFRNENDTNIVTQSVDSMLQFFCKTTKMITVSLNALVTRFFQLLHFDNIQVCSSIKNSDSRSVS